MNGRNNNGGNNNGGVNANGSSGGANNNGGGLPFAVILVIQAAVPLVALVFATCSILGLIIFILRRWLFLRILTYIHYCSCMCVYIFIYFFKFIYVFI